MPYLPKKLEENFNYLIRAFFGKSRSRAFHRRDKCDFEQYDTRLACFIERVKSEKLATRQSKSGSPVFLLSAGWRSGSTLLQRMLMSQKKDILIWGEPFAHTQLFDRMMLQFSGFTKTWPPQEFFVDQANFDSIIEQWIANLYPDIECFLSAHEAFFNTLFAEPAMQRGFRQWGVKEVRLDARHARYLRMLFPDSKIVFLVRDPVRAWASYRPTGEWYKSWPDRPIFTPYEFGRNWSDLASSYIQQYKELDGFLVKYEDLNDATVIEHLEEYIGWSVDRSSELTRVGSTSASGRLPWIPKLDNALLRLGLRGAQKQFGYK